MDPVPPARRASRARSRRERGTAAVEFALISPLLFTLLIGVLEFSNAWYVKATIEGVARETAREYALTSSVEEATQTMLTNGERVNLQADEVTITPEDGCSTGEDVVVSINHTHHFITGWFGQTIQITGDATIQCYG